WFLGSSVRAGLTYRLRGLSGEGREVLLEQSSKVVGPAIVFRGIGPGAARRKKGIGHSRTALRHLQTEDRIGGERHDVQLPSQGGPEHRSSMAQLHATPSAIGTARPAGVDQPHGGTVRL